MTTNYQLTRDQLITGALRMAEVIDHEETPTANQISVGAESLNLLCASLENLGLPLWKVRMDEYSLTEGLNKITIANDRPLEITNAVLHYVDSNSDITMVRLSRQEYLLMGNKESKSFPTQYYYEQDKTSGTIYLYPSVSAAAQLNCKVRIWSRHPFDVVMSANEYPDFPKQFQLALKTGLASLLAHEFSAPSRKKQELAALAKTTLEDALDYNNEHTSIYFNLSKYGGYQ